MKNSLSLSLALLTIFLAVAATAQEYPSAMSDYVNDFADIVDPDTEQRIEQTLRDLRNNDGIEMTVVTINAIADYRASGSIPKFATGLFNAWGVGDATRNDGVLFLTSLKDREVFIALGDSYDTAYDSQMDRIFEEHIKPYFIEDRYSAGIEAGTLETIRSLSVDPSENKPNFFQGSGEYTFFIILGTVVLVAVFWRTIGDSLYKFKRCPNCRRRMLHRRRNVAKQATRTSKGREEIWINCGYCDYRHQYFYTIPMSSPSSWDGGGSFGGGSSSGGGGGGSW